jgi:hypothetical protein
MERTKITYDVARMCDGETVYSTENPKEALTMLEFETRATGKSHIIVRVTMEIVAAGLVEGETNVD